MAEKTRKGSCDGCGKVRKLTYPADRTREVMYHPDGMRKLLSSDQHAEAHKELIHYYGLCSECFPEVKHQDDIIRLRKARPKKESAPRFAYPIIGGPLDGQYAVTGDFYPTIIAGGNSAYGAHKKGDVLREGGMYGHLANEYVEYNGASGGRKKLGAFPPSMVWIHRSLLKPLASPKDR